MGWIYLIIAGLLETVWAGLLKSVSGDFSVLRVGLLAAALVGSMVFLALAMRALPVSIAYPVWTGIGSAGAVIIGVLVFGEALSWRVLAGLGLLVGGMVLLASETV